MSHSLRSWMRGGLVPAALLALFISAGCSSDPGPGERREATHRKPPTPMAGHELFFDGRILAEISVGTDGMPDVGPGSGGGGQRSQGGGRGRRGGGGLGMQGGPGGFSGNVAGSVPFGEGGGRSRSEVRPRIGLGGGGRPVMIHLRFTNQAPAAASLGIVDFVSPLGNFAVRPEQLTIEAGAALETEPMTSQLAGALSEVNVTLVLRLGEQSERKTFTLQALPAAAPAEPVQAPNPPKS